MDQDQVLETGGEGQSWKALERTGIQFYQNFRHLDAFSWALLLIIVVVQVLAARALLGLLVHIVRHWNGFRATTRLIVNRVMDIRPRSGGHDRALGPVLNDGDGEETQDTEHGVPPTPTMSKADSEEDDDEDVFYLPTSKPSVTNCSDSCVCCKVRNVISAIFLWTAGSGDGLRHKSPRTVIPHSPNDGGTNGDKKNDLISDNEIKHVQLLLKRGSSLKKQRISA